MAYGISTVRLHGNGFAQVDLAPNVRLHVWDSELPRQKVPTPIHNHRFSFRSTVLYGRLGHRVYRPSKLLGYHPEGAQLYRAVQRDKEDTVLDPTGRYVTLVGAGDVGSYEYSPGDWYEFPAGRFHESVALTDTVVTVMQKTSQDDSVEPLVIVPAGVEPDNGRYNVNLDFVARRVIRALGLILGTQVPIWPATNPMREILRRSSR